ncbi:hypothetical protein HU200_033275 [Digitaria exilis]|uniref:Neprosin PEP catalytic domain-containing protein n=1 Tax=Digitaria exilis TaxID=1010633 RepID=A0A835EPT2_9POAL|nr:hypothetical protein HU200_033275 [Digitaria exilis]
MVGYFPKEIINGMSAATEVQMGGITYSPSGQKSPPMGSGVAPGGKVAKSRVTKDVSDPAIYNVELRSNMVAPEAPNAAIVPIRTRMDAEHASRDHDVARVVTESPTQPPLLRSCQSAMVSSKRGPMSFDDVAHCRVQKGGGQAWTEMRNHLGVGERVDVAGSAVANVRLVRLVLGGGGRQKGWLHP